MQDEIKYVKSLNEALAEMISDVTSAGNFLKGQLPDVIKELLRWELLYYLACFITAIVTSIITVVVALVYWDNYWLWVEVTPMDGKVFFVGAFIMTALCTAVITTMCTFNIQWLKILIAPKVYLLEYASKLVG